MAHSSGDVCRRSNSGYISMNAGPKFTALLLIFLLLGTACRSDSPQKENSRPPVTEHREPSDSVFLILDYSTIRADTSAMILSSSDTLTVLELLQTLTARDSVVLKTKSYPIGVMVEQIGDRKNGDGGYWLYTVNGEAIPKAVSAYPICPGDTIRFFFET